MIFGLVTYLILSVLCTLLVRIIHQAVADRRRARDKPSLTGLLELKTLHEEALLRLELVPDRARQASRHEEVGSEPDGTVREQLQAMRSLDEGDAAALKVLTRYATINGRPVAAEVLRERARGEVSDVERLLRRAAGPAQTAGRRGRFHRTAAAAGRGCRAKLLLGQPKVWLKNLSIRRFITSLPAEPEDVR